MEKEKKEYDKVFKIWMKNFGELLGLEYEQMAFMKCHVPFVGFLSIAHHKWIDWNNSINDDMTSKKLKMFIKDFKKFNREYNKAKKTGNYEAFKERESMDGASAFYRGKCEWCWEGHVEFEGEHTKWNDAKEK